LTLKRNHPYLAESAHNWLENNREELSTTKFIALQSSCEAGHHRLEKRCFFSAPVQEVFSAAKISVEPAKRRPGYANFAIAEPPLKLVLIKNAAKA
jgi:hypothetical protein